MNRNRLIPILIALLLLLLLNQAALAADDWVCPQCGKRVREIVGDICPYCGYERHVHDWAPATCVRPKTCKTCGETEGGPDLTSHQWDEGRTIYEATCTNQGVTRLTCTVCGGTEDRLDPVNPERHTWDAGKVIHPATCVAIGLAHYTCTGCGREKDDIIPENPENHPGETEIRGEKKALCAEEGYTGDVYCKACGRLLSTGRLRPVTGRHRWQAATKTAPRTCRVCGKTEREPRPPLRVGDVIAFGCYNQDNHKENGLEEIQWQVLELDEVNQKALLISKFGLEARPYHKEQTNVTWETCSLRKWLNEDFLETAFTKAERQAILVTNVDNGKTQGNMNTDGGNPTRDSVFLLSYAEAVRYYGVYWVKLMFNSNTASRAFATGYARSQGAKTSDSFVTEQGWNAGSWWLRSTNGNHLQAVRIGSEGSAAYSDITDASNCVRPVLWVCLEALDHDAATAKTLNESSSSMNRYNMLAGDIITFGTYPQMESGRDKTPIEWQVLEVDEAVGRALLVSRYGLESKPYHKSKTGVSWETCSLRKWLNEDFLKKAFTKAEQDAILVTDVDNSLSQGYVGGKTTRDGKNTQDRIFLLSNYERIRCLERENQLIDLSHISPTEYAIAQGTTIGYYWKNNEGRDVGIWWLRTGGDNMTAACYVSVDSTVYGSDVDATDFCVRPALWIDLESGIF